SLARGLLRRLGPGDGVWRFVAQPALVALLGEQAEDVFPAHLAVPGQEAVGRPPAGRQWRIGHVTVLEREDFLRRNMLKATAADAGPLEMIGVDQQAAARVADRGEYLAGDLEVVQPIVGGTVLVGKPQTVRLNDASGLLQSGDGVARGALARP